jgi:ribonucleoside-diphosphate reductase alpha chain
VYCILNLPFDSEEAQIVNKKIFETIYFGCCEASMELSKVHGPYESYEGSPFSKGQLQWHLWGLTEKDLLMDWDWSGLIANIKKYGMRNSLLTALMPTASTSQIMTSNECHEPYTSNLYTRSTLAGEFVVINKYLVETLIKDGLWTEELKEELLYDGGSVQKIQEIPDRIKQVYKTAFEMKTRPVIDQAVARSPFIDQSQSLNLFAGDPNFDSLRMTHIYGWKKGLKTGLYYLRSKPAVNPLEFGLEFDAIRRIKKKRGEEVVDEYIDDSENQESIISDDSNWKDPRKESEIETSGKVVDRRSNNYTECEMCSG